MHNALQKCNRKTDQNEKGQSMVEFALCLPFLVLLICIIIDFGWVFSCKNDLTNLAGQAARYGAIQAGTNSANYDTKVREFVSQNGYNAKGTGTISVISVTKSSDGIVTVELQENVKYLTGLTGIFTGGGNDVTLKAKSASPIDPYS